MNTNIKKFDEYTNENRYKVNDEGMLEKQEYEMYKDHHPQKFLYNKDATLYSSETVWVIKHQDEIIATFNGDLDEEIVKSFYEKINK